MKNTTSFYYRIAYVSLIVLSLHLCSCSTDKVKQKINETGDAAGQVIGELATGITTGVKKTIEPKIELSEGLKMKGIAFGKMMVSGDSAGLENVLITYIIFNTDFNGHLTAKAFDNKKLEMGRVKIEVSGKKDEAKYFEFHFDKRTDIDNDSELTIE